jgi:hypothetical protein
MADQPVSLVSELWLPFLATVGASLTVLAIEAINRYVKEQRQRVYAVGFMVDVLYRLVHAELIILKHTIAPHIEATKRMLSGDCKLLEVTLDADEFDILAAGPMTAIDLPPDHKLLVGYDNIQLVRAFDSLLYLNSDDTQRTALRSFVAENLKSKKKFLEIGIEHQHDILNTYWDYLRALEHQANRLVAFAFHIFTPMLRTYAGSKRFTLFSTKQVFAMLDRISALQSDFKDFVPTPEFFKQSRDGGIQRVL